MIHCLKGSGIPVLREHRTAQDPKIILGGPITFSNPLPASLFVDAILLGEVEDIVVSAFKLAFDSKSTWLEEMSKIPGVFSSPNDDKFATNCHQSFGCFASSKKPHHLSRFIIKKYVFN